VLAGAYLAGAWAKRSSLSQTTGELLALLGISDIYTVDQHFISQEDSKDNSQKLRWKVL